MDTISRESNTSYIPIASAFVAAIALLLGGVALYKVSSLGKKVPENLPDQLASVESKADSANGTAETAKANIATLKSSVQTAFDSIGPEIGNLKASVAKLEDAAKAHAAPPKAGTAKSGEPVVAGPGEYVVKPGDTGMKIVKATGVSLSELENLNPGINWKSLKVGQKIKTK